MRRLDREGTRTTLVVTLVVAAFILTALIAFRAYAGAIYHRATAEKVVRDWTRVAQDELVRRVNAQASFYGTYPILQMLAGTRDTPTGSQLLAAAGSDEMRRNAQLVHATFRFDTGTGQLTASAGADAVMGKRLAEALARIAAAPPAPSEREPLYLTIDGHPKTFVWLPSDAEIVALEIDPDQLYPFFETVLAQRPLLPESLARGRFGNETLFIRATTPSGRTIFTSSGRFDQHLGIRQRVENGLLQGFLMETSIAHQAARTLVIGGLAPAAPVYFVMLAIAGGLMLVAILQIRKERALARLRSDFVSSVSHELRTPLTQIRMFAETLLLDRVRSEEERRRYLTIIEQETRRLSQLVENILQFSRGERGTLRISPVRCDVLSLTRETLASFQPIAAARNVRLTLHGDEAVVLSVDDDAVRQVILNLLDNAVKYGPEGQEVVVTLEKSGGWVRWSVDDQGPGVPLSDRKRIWRRYERLQRERVRAIAGAGIGLAIVRDIVDLHRGRAWVEQGDGGGARFVVELPTEVQS